MKFFDAVLEAGRSFRAVQDKEPEISGENLAEYLRSEKPIGRGERELLAQLVTGEMRNSSKPTRNHARTIKAAVRVIKEKEDLTWPVAVREFLKEHPNYNFEQVLKMCRR